LGIAHPRVDPVRAHLPEALAAARARAIFAVFSRHAARAIRSTGLAPALAVAAPRASAGSARGWHALGAYATVRNGGVEACVHGASRAAFPQGRVAGARLPVAPRNKKHGGQSGAQWDSLSHRGWTRVRKARSTLALGSRAVGKTDSGGNAGGNIHKDSR
jgi:hypothetical protein